MGATCRRPFPSRLRLRLIRRDRLLRDQVCFRTHLQSRSENLQPARYSISPVLACKSYAPTRLACSLREQSQNHFPGDALIPWHNPKRPVVDLRVANQSPARIRQNRARCRPELGRQPGRDAAPNQNERDERRHRRCARVAVVPTRQDTALRIPCSTRRGAGKSLSTIVQTAKFSSTILRFVRNQTVADFSTKIRLVARFDVKPHDTSSEI